MSPPGRWDDDDGLVIRCRGGEVYNLLNGGGGVPEEPTDAANVDDGDDEPK